MSLDEPSEKADGSGMTAPATAVTSGVTPTLVPQPHGGAIRRGNPGNKGGGSHPDRIRRMARERLVDRLPILAQIADGVSVELLHRATTDANGKLVETQEWRMFTPEPKDRLAAIKALADIGMGASVTMADVRERLRQQVDVIRQTLPQEQAEQLLDALRSVWK